MDRDPQKISAALADPTRYRIYQHLLTAPQHVTAQEIARHFDLHPNVARMHLGKLAEVDLVAVHTKRSGKGGRPGYVYGPSGNAVSLHVSPRDFQVLADLLVQSLALLGDGALEAIHQIGRAFGSKLAREAMETIPGGASEPEMPMQVCAAALQRLGVAAQLIRSDDGAVNLMLKTCGFHELATAHPEHVCLLCKAMVEGISATCISASSTVSQTSSVPKGATACIYEMSGLIQLES